MENQRNIPGADSNDAEYAAKWKHTKTGLANLSKYKKLDAEKDESILATVKEWQDQVKTAIPEFEHPDSTSPEFAHESMLMTDEKKALRINVVGVQESTQ